MSLCVEKDRWWAPNLGKLLFFLLQILDLPLVLVGELLRNLDLTSFGMFPKCPLTSGMPWVPGMLGLRWGCSRGYPARFAFPPYDPVLSQSTFHNASTRGWENDGKRSKRQLLTLLPFAALPLIPTCQRMMYPWIIALDMTKYSLEVLFIYLLREI